MSFGDDLDTVFEDLGEKVSMTNGAHFFGELVSADAVAFEAVVHGTHILRHPRSVALIKGESLFIGGREYRVADVPRPHDGQVELVRA